MRMAKSGREHDNQNPIDGTKTRGRIKSFSRVQQIIHAARWQKRRQSQVLPNTDTEPVAAVNKGVDDNLTTIDRAIPKTIVTTATNGRENKQKNNSDDNKSFAPTSPASGVTTPDFGSPALTTMTTTGKTGTKEDIMNTTRTTTTTIPMPTSESTANSKRLPSRGLNNASLFPSTGTIANEPSDGKAAQIDQEAACVASSRSSLFSDDKSNNNKTSKSHQQSGPVADSDKAASMPATKKANTKRRSPSAAPAAPSVSSASPPTQRAKTKRARTQRKKASGATTENPEVQGQWNCPSCTYTNNSRSRRCQICHTRKPVIVTAPTSSEIANKRTKPTATISNEKTDYNNVPESKTPSPPSTPTPMATKTKCEPSTNISNDKKRKSMDKSDASQISEPDKTNVVNRSTVVEATATGNANSSNSSSPAPTEQQDDADAAPNKETDKANKTPTSQSLKLVVEAPPKILVHDDLPTVPRKKVKQELPSPSVGKEKLAASTSAVKRVEEVAHQSVETTTTTTKPEKLAPSTSEPRTSSKADTEEEERTSGTTLSVRDEPATDLVKAALRDTNQEHGVKTQVPPEEDVVMLRQELLDCRRTCDQLRQQVRAYEDYCSQLQQCYAEHHAEQLRHSHNETLAQLDEQLLQFRQTRQAAFHRQLQHPFRPPIKPPRLVLHKIGDSNNGQYNHDHCSDNATGIHSSGTTNPTHQTVQVLPKPVTGAAPTAAVHGTVESNSIHCTMENGQVCDTKQLELCSKKIRVGPQHPLSTKVLPLPNLLLEKRSVQHFPKALEVSGDADGTPTCTEQSAARPVAKNQLSQSSHVSTHDVAMGSQNLLFTSQQQHEPKHLPPKPSLAMRQKSGGNTCFQPTQTDRTTTATENQETCPDQCGVTTGNQSAEKFPCSRSENPAATVQKGGSSTSRPKRNPEQSCEVDSVADGSRYLPTKQTRFRALPLANSTNRQQGDSTSTLDKKKNKSTHNDAGWFSNAPSRAFLQELEPSETAQADARRQHEKTPTNRTGAWVSARRRSAPADMKRNKPGKTDTALWDDLPTSSTNPTKQTNQNATSNQFKYHEVVRCKAVRQGLPCRDCPECRAFYDVLRRTGDHLVNSQSTLQFSRHRTRFTPPETPADFWELEFIDEKRKREQQEQRLQQHRQSPDVQDI